jgi:predicted nucleic acid-binding Zn ribbon protein
MPIKNKPKFKKSASYGKIITKHRKRKNNYTILWLKESQKAISLVW